MRKTVIFLMFLFTTVSGFSQGKSVQGKVTGENGNPLKGVTIQVRGGASITQDNSPLYNLDGVQVENALGIASFFVAGKSELFPFDQATITSYQGKLKQNPGY